MPVCKKTYDFISHTQPSLPYPAPITLPHYTTESTDVLLLTCGIVPAKKREESVDGIEMDMAVSAISRHTILKAASPRLPPHARVLIWGFPGSKGYYKQTNLKDFNSETSYTGGFGTPHMNTVALNEALVHHWSKNGLSISGYNPGLIRSGIRDSMHGGPLAYLGTLMESMIALFNPSADEYATKILPLLTAPELMTPAFNGLFFNQSGQPIKGAPEFNDPSIVSQWIKAADDLVKKADSKRQV